MTRTRCLGVVVRRSDSPGDPHVTLDVEPKIEALAEAAGVAGGGR